MPVLPQAARHDFTTYANLSSPTSLLERLSKGLLQFPKTRSNMRSPSDDLGAFTKDSRYYQAVVSLNNTGISLLQRGMFAAARDTLKSAIEFLNSAFESTSRTTKTWEELDEALNMAATRSCLPTKQANVCDILATHLDRDNMLDRILESPSLDCCIRLEPTPSMWDSDSNADLEAVVLLYNYGLAQLWLSGGQRPLRWSYRIFLLSEKIASMSFVNLNRSRPAPGMVVVAILLIRKMMQLTAEFGMTEESHAYRGTLKQMLYLLAQEELGLPNPKDRSAPAA